jgi:hypothetical protein
VASRLRAWQRYFSPDISERANPERRLAAIIL